MMESQLYQSILQEGRVEGRVEGEAKALLSVLALRFDYADESLSTRVRAETRMPLLESWFQNAVILADKKALRSLVATIKNTPLPPAP